MFIVTNNIRKQDRKTYKSGTPFNGITPLAFPNIGERAMCNCRISNHLHLIRQINENNRRTQDKSLRYGLLQELLPAPLLEATVVLVLLDPAEFII